MLASIVATSIGASRADAFVNEGDPNYWANMTEQQQQTLIDWFNSQRPGVPDVDPASAAGKLAAGEAAADAGEVASSATLARAGAGLLGELSGVGTIILGADLAVKVTTGQGLIDRVVIFGTSQFYPSDSCATSCGFRSGFPRDFRLEPAAAGNHYWATWMGGGDAGPAMASDGWVLWWNTGEPATSPNSLPYNNFVYFNHLNPPVPLEVGGGTMNRVDVSPGHYEGFTVPDWGLPIKRGVHKLVPGEELPADTRTVTVPQTPPAALPDTVKTWIQSPDAAPVRTWLATNPSDVGTLVGAFPAVDPDAGTSAPADGSSADPNRTATPADTDPSTCELPSVRAIDLGPLSVPLSDKFPFGIFGWLSGALGGLVAGGVAPRIVIPMPGGIDPLVMDLAPFSGIWDVIHPVMLICAFLSLAWLFASTAMGLGAGAGSDSD